MKRSGERPGRSDEVEWESPIRASTLPTPRDPRVTVVSSELPTLEGGLVPGERVGRYVILNLIGRGGMGVVYSAYDPELDRKIALKLLLTTDADAGSRLQREAQAMAKLSHPNVVAIHDVGAHDGQIYLAMEFVNGDTLDAWLHTHRPPSAEILELFIAAGEGLAAAHKAGLIHRDVKPENIMICRDKRVRVMDFGLARADQAPAPKLTGQHPSLAHLSRSNVLSSELTQEGLLVGTPLYMAPEQWLGLPTDTRSDVFSFAVALWEALYGVHPFRSDSPAGVAVAVTEGLLQEPPSRSTVPPWIRRVLTKGLQTAPENRWPSMRSFVDALLDDPAPRIRKFLIAGIAIAAALVIFVSWRLDHSRQVRACERDATTIDSVWSPAIGRELQQAMLDTGVGFAKTSSSTAIDMLGAYADAWSTTRHDTCIDELSGDITPALSRRINTCLDDRRDALGALVKSLCDADAGVVEGAVNTVASLQQPEICADPEQLGAYEELPKHLEEIASAQLQRLATIQAQAIAGRFAQASEAAEAAKADAHETQLAHLEVRATITAGKVAELRGDFPAARQEYEAALYTAGRNGADGLAAEASLSLAWIDGVRLAEFELGIAYTQLAKMWLEHLEVPEGDLRWQRYHHVVSSLYDDHADYDRAREHQEKAIAIAESTLGPDHPVVSGSVNNLGLIFRARGEPAIAREHFRRALRIRETTYGPDHPQVAVVVANLGLAEVDLGNLDVAQKLLQRSLEIRVRTFGPDHQEVASALLNVAMVTYQRSDFQAALQGNLRALEIQERRFGPEHPRVATNLFNIGVIKGDLGDYEGAEAALTRTLKIQHLVYPPDHPRIGITLTALAELALERHNFKAALEYIERGEPMVTAKLGAEHREYASLLTIRGAALLGLGNPKEAAAQHRQALAIIESKLGADHQRMLDPLLCLANDQLALKDFDGALLSAEHALALFEENSGNTHDRAKARFAIARARWHTAATRDQALRHALEARELAITAGAGAAALKLDIDAWLKAHGQRLP